MDDQIQLNILGDGIVSETLSQGIQYLIFKSKEDGEEGERYRDALHHLRIQNEELSNSTLRFGGNPHPSSIPPKKVVTFTPSSSQLPEPTSGTVQEPNTPYPSSTNSFVYDTNIQITRL